MKKLLLWLAVLCTLLLCTPAMAEVFILDEIFASIELPQEYVVLTERNMANYEQWLGARGTSLE